MSKPREYTAESFSNALDEAYWCYGGIPFNLIYLDFLSQPDFDAHYRSGLLKIMRAKMLTPTGTLILNFGKNRCREATAGLNRDLLAAADDVKLPVVSTVPTEIYVGAAIEEAKHPAFKKMYSQSYISDNGGRTVTYVTTVVKF